GSGAIPSMATVQKHLEAVRQSTAGMGAWDAVRLQQLDVIAELLQTLTFIEPEAACYVTGRAAEGFVDDTAPAHLRLVGGRGPALVADDLETQGFPPCT
ncbi:MAG: hypothetical protein QF781_10660, partial [Phycisphaerales bacterium]|nr:hypothetical protein [Phycisphaerales bacterium]